MSSKAAISGCPVKELMRKDFSASQHHDRKLRNKHSIRDPTPSHSSQWVPQTKQNWTPKSALPRLKKNELWRKSLIPSNVQKGRVIKINSFLRRSIKTHKCKFKRKAKYSSTLLSRRSVNTCLTDTQCAREQLGRDPHGSAVRQRHTLPSDTFL